MPPMVAPVVAATGIAMAASTIAISRKKKTTTTTMVTRRDTETAKAVTACVGQGPSSTAKNRK